MNIDQFISKLESSDAYRHNKAVRKLVDESRQSLVDLAHGDDGDAFKAEFMKFNDRLDIALKPPAIPSAKPATAPETSESGKTLIGNLKSRFDSHPDWHKGVEWAEVEKALREDPEALRSLQNLEVTGGEPQVVGIEGGEFVFEDRSEESPSGRRNLDFDQADAQRKGFGPNVRFQSSDSYRAMQKTGKFDLESWSWLETDAKTREAGNALDGYRGVEVVFVSVGPAGAHGPYRGWRAALRVKKA